MRLIVSDNADGVVVDTAGTWIAGANGPATLIMPGEPWSAKRPSG